MSGLNAFGTQLKRGDGAGTEVFAAIANVTSISGPELSRETIDVTAHDSVDAWMEFVGGLKDGGEISLDVNYDPAEHDVLVGDFDDDDPRNYQLAFPVTPAVVWSVKALLTGFSSEAPYDDKLAASITLKVSGKPTIGTGA
ncbi:putative secreted protein [Actinomadura coerulea]|uniref:Putative secreted protein n=1 Tax=Actinomadura coerulea TaxID=46159 RepID=A0A7X0L377_9ACTN|nr:phage tail tube protein [Actinomadura coerulea]MBB6400516.1 putative secreted protein [Actinomadura coerulea]GGQ07784.1 phage capsid protein [Actinomadura coerulea]